MTATNQSTGFKHKQITSSNEREIQDGIISKLRRLHIGQRNATQLDATDSRVELSDVNTLTTQTQLFLAFPNICGILCSRVELSCVHIGQLDCKHATTSTMTNNHIVHVASCVASVAENEEQTKRARKSRRLGIPDATRSGTGFCEIVHPAQHCYCCSL